MNLLLSTSVSAIVDIVALSLIIVFAVWGFMHGFVKTFFSAFGTIMSLLLAIILAPSVVNFLQDKYDFITTVSNGLTATLSGYFGNDVMNLTINEASREVLSGAGLTGFILDIIISVQADGSVSRDAKLSQIICSTFGYYLTFIICAIALFIVLKLIFKLISEIAKKRHAEGKGFIKLDKALGFALGLVHGIIILEFAIIAIKTIPLGFMQDIYVGVQASVVAGLIEKISLFNLLMGLLTRVNVVGFIKNLL